MAPDGMMTTSMWHGIRILMLTVLCGWLWLPAQAALSVSPSYSAGHMAHMASSIVMSHRQTSRLAEHKMAAPTHSVVKVASSLRKIDCPMQHRSGDCPMPAHGTPHERSSHCAACLSVVADMPPPTLSRVEARGPDRVWPGPSVAYTDFIPGIPSPPPCHFQA